HRRLEKLVHFRSPFTRGMRPAHTAVAFTGCSFLHSENTGHSVRHTLRAVRHLARAWKRVSPSPCGSHRKPFSGIAHGPTPSAARATTFSSTGGSSIARRRLADASRNVRRFASTHASQGFSPRFRCRSYALRVPHDFNSRDIRHLLQPMPLKQLNQRQLLPDQVLVLLFLLPRPVQTSHQLLITSPLRLQSALGVLQSLRQGSDDWVSHVVTSTGRRPPSSSNRTHRRRRHTRTSAGLWP